MATGDGGVTTDMAEVLSEALLENIRTKNATDVARFLATLPEDARKHLFPFANENQNQYDGEDPSVVWKKFPHPYLHVACKYGTIDVVLLLLMCGVDPTLRTEQEGTALEVATRRGNLDMLKKLIEWKPELIDDDEDTVKNLLAISCSFGHQDVAEYWLEELTKLKDGQTPCKEDFIANDPLIAACKGGHYQLASYLVERKVTVINRETAFRTGKKFIQLLELWCNNQTEETQDRLVQCEARWNERQLHAFDAGWLPPHSELQRTLVKIDLSHNALKKIPEVLLWGLPLLESLDLSYNSIAKLPGPETLEQLTNTRMTKLNVSNNKLSYPALEIFMLPLLEILDLSYNDITSLNHKRFPSKLVKPETGEIIWDCSNMMALNLSYNQIIRIPQDISTAKSLKKLNICKNRLAKLPSPWDCPLTNFYASDNNISEVPDMHAHWSRSLVSLDLSCNNLSEIPWTVCQLTALNTLNLAGNHITKLPPANAWSIYSLRELYLSNNRLLLVEKPSSPSSANVKRLSAYSKILMKGITSTPTSTFYSTPTGSEAESEMVFPEIFRDSLVTLDLNNNELQSIPPSISDLVCLQKLDLSGNGIEKLPDTLAQLTNLYYLNLDGLKIKEPETVVAVMQERGPHTRNILEKLKERRLGCSPYRGMKLILVGPENCGKTSVLSSLVGIEPDDDLGINIGSWTLQNPAVMKEKSSFKKKLFTSKQSDPSQDFIEFSTWDLKGGELNSIIHQSFLTPRALYLLVWDLRDGSTGVEKLRPWLLNIQSRASESVIVIVSTHLDKAKKNRTLESIRNEITMKYTCRDGFPDIADIIEVTAIGQGIRDGIHELRQLIYKTALEMKIRKWHSGASSYIPLIGRMVPHTFKVLKEIMANENKRRKGSKPPLSLVMKEDELATQIKKIPNNKIETGQDIEEAAEFLSTCGSLVHFSDHLQGLTNLYFLDPVWLYNILSDVANIKSSCVKEGRIRKQSLEELFLKSGFGEGHFEEYLQLIQRLEIILPISRIEFLIPSRLPREKPGEDFSPTQGEDKSFQVLERLYKLPYTPPGFWSRLVSRVYVFLKFLDKESNRKSKGVSKTKLARSAKLKRSSRMNQSLRVGVKLTHTNIMYWQQGVSVQHQTGQILLKPVTFQGGKPGICVRILCADGVFKPMGFMVDQIENLMKEWYPGLLDSEEFSGQPLVKRLVPCPICKRTNAETENPYSLTPMADNEDNVHHFTITELALAATVRGLENVECPRHPQESMALPKLIPDLLLMDLSVTNLDKKSFDFHPGLSRSLGTGGYGEVFRAKFRRQDVAVKVLIRSKFLRSSRDSGMHSPAGDKESKQSSSTSDLSDSGKQSLTPRLYDENNADLNAMCVIEGFSNLRSEVATMSKLRHPCVIQLIGISIQHLCFAMELAPLGDLANLLKKEGDNQRESFTMHGKVYQTLLDRVLTYKIALQVARGVSYLHSKRVIYSDLKTDNVLMYSLALDAPVNIKLTDYGIARSMDLQGARGMAGPMGFCAPEILRGRTFTEKVDWFSYSMLLYHLMTGAWPYDNLKSAIEIRSAVNTGVKPGFNFRDYSIITLFPNLERLMQQCWRENPLERPSGSDIAMVMENTSFKCLKNVIRLDLEEIITCLHPGSGEVYENSDRLWLWTGSGASRQCTKIHIKYFTEGDLFSKQFRGSQANCMVQVGHWELIGTKDNRIQLFGPPAIGPQQNVFQQDFHLDAEVLCLCYQPVNDEDIQGRLFAGLADGHVITFNYTHVVSSSSSNQQELAWSKSKILTFENKKCNLLELVPEREELWIACGNKLRVLSTKIMLLENPAITVTPRAERAILGLAHHHDNLFCIIERSSRVLQYSMANRQLVQVLQCGNVTLARGDCLVSQCEVVEEEDEDGYKDQEEDEAGSISDGSPVKFDTDKEFSFRDSHFRSSSQHQLSSKSISDGSPVKFDTDEEFGFRDSHFSSSSPQHQPSPSSTLPPSKHCQQKTIPSIVNRPYSDGNEYRKSIRPVPQVRSILTVKDTLWVGMSAGETLITCIDLENQHKHNFGEVLAILSLFSEFGDDNGPVTQLLRVGAEHVVAWQELKKLPVSDKTVSGKTVNPHHYQLLVWQSWGSHDIWKFERIHQMLTEAEVDLGN